MLFLKSVLQILKVTNPMNFKNILIIGAGTMGKGIAQWFAQNNFDTELFDINKVLLEKSLQSIQTSWNVLEKKGKFSSEDISRFNKDIAITTSPNYRKYDLIIEAVVEDITIKNKIFTEIENKLESNSRLIIATNTSSISIDKLASNFKTFNKSNFLGIHFFNPATIMKLVELVKGKETSIEMIEKFKRLFNNKGKKAVISIDSPGFIVNRVNRNFFGEALIQLKTHSHQQVKQIDKIYKEIAGFKMGPFELIDLIGVDVNLDVTKSVWNQFDKNPRFSPHQIQQDLVDDKKFGKKNGEGFYKYE